MLGGCGIGGGWEGELLTRRQEGGISQERAPGPSGRFSGAESIHLAEMALSLSFPLIPRISLFKFQFPFP